MRRRRGAGRNVTAAFGLHSCGLTAACAVGLAGGQARRPADPARLYLLPATCISCSLKRLWLRWELGWTPGASLASHHACKTRVHTAWASLLLACVVDDTIWTDDTRQTSAILFLGLPLGTGRCSSLGLAWAETSSLLHACSIAPLPSTGAAWFTTPGVGTLPAAASLPFTAPASCSALTALFSFTTSLPLLHTPAACYLPLPSAILFPLACLPFCACEHALQHL